LIIDRFASSYELAGFSLNRAAETIGSQLARLGAADRHPGRSRRLCYEVEVFLRCSAPVLIDLASQVLGRNRDPSAGTGFGGAARGCRYWVDGPGDLMAETQRVVIVGAGVIGLLTAVQCTLAGHQVTVLEQGTIPTPTPVHPTSTARSVPCTRRTPPPRRWASSAYRRWLALERLLGTRFYRRIGALTAFPADEIDAALAVASEADIAINWYIPVSFHNLVFPPDRLACSKRTAVCCWRTECWRQQPSGSASSRRCNCGPSYGGPGRRRDGPGSTCRRLDRDGRSGVRCRRPLVPALLAASLVLYRQTMLYLQSTGAVPVRLARHAGSRSHRCRRQGMAAATGAPARCSRSARRPSVGK